MVRDGKTVGAVITFSTSLSERRRKENCGRASKGNAVFLRFNNAIINNLTQEALFASAYEANFVGSFPSTGLPSFSTCGNENTEAPLYEH